MTSTSARVADRLGVAWPPTPDHQRVPCDHLRAAGGVAGGEDVDELAIRELPGQRMTGGERQRDGARGRVGGREAVGRQVAPLNQLALADRLEREAADHVVGLDERRRFGAAELIVSSPS